MELKRQTRFEQVPLAIALKVAREQAKLTQIAIAKAILWKGGGKK
jgi:hypothetical protein